MKREDKYPETSSFIYFNKNPKNRKTCDCWLRAVSDALDADYNEVLRELCDVQVKTGYELSDSKAIDIYLKSKGWVKCPQPRKSDNTKYTGRDFCDWLSINYKDGELGNLVCNIGGHHMVSIKPTWHGDGFNCRYKVHDIWNSTGGCIGNYWRKVV